MIIALRRIVHVVSIFYQNFISLKLVNTRGRMKFCLVICENASGKTMQVSFQVLKSAEAISLFITFDTKSLRKRFCIMGQPFDL